MKKIPTIEQLKNMLKRVNEYSRMMRNQDNWYDEMLIYESAKNYVERFLEEYVVSKEVEMFMVKRLRKAYFRPYER